MCVCIKCIRWTILQRYYICCRFLIVKPGTKLWLPFSNQLVQKIANCLMNDSYSMPHWPHFSDPVFHPVNLSVVPAIQSSSLHIQWGFNMTEYEEAFRYTRLSMVGFAVNISEVGKESNSLLTSTMVSSSARRYARHFRVRFSALLLYFGTY